METTYFKIIGQKTAGKLVLIMVVPENMIAENLPSIFEVQAFKMPATIYTGTYPQIKINTETIKDRTEDLKGMGIAGILTEERWYNKSVETKDTLGISLK